MNLKATAPKLFLNCCISDIIIFNLIINDVRAWQISSYHYYTRKAEVNPYWLGQKANQLELAAGDIQQVISNLKASIMLLRNTYNHQLFQTIEKQPSMSTSGKEHDFFAKVIVVGDSGVGKTNLITKFCDDVFQDNYVATIGVDFKLKTVQVESTRIKLQIWDTAGQQRFRNITQTYFKGASAIILAYQISSAETFRNLAKWIKQVESTSDEDICKVLLGTKIDLEAERQISTRQAKEFALKHNMIFEEVSAKSGINVNQAFMIMAKDLRKRRISARWQGQGGVLLRSGICSQKKKCLC